MSRRLINKADGMGFSFSDTIIKAGTETKIWYKNHLEAVYCISGNGSIKDLATGITHDIKPGVLYALNLHDRHILRGGTEDMHMVCVFYPALRGNEVHDKDGSYPADDSG
jgi:L-ectoine synthase